MKNRKKERMRGSATVEASFVMGFIVIIIFSLITFSLNLMKETKYYFEEKQNEIIEDEFYRKIPSLIRISSIFTEDDKNGD